MSSLTIKNKKGTVIHRTTSESLRLGDDILNNHSQARVQSTNSRKKSQTTSPSCSFQITGVSLTRYDVGEDSADDLDESHTDDISRVTDNETPSFSEDSRDIDDQPQQLIYNNSATTVPQPQPTAPKAESEVKWQEKEKRDVGLGRFKVVKIESVVPFSRGRWTCFDYLDQTDNSSRPSFVFCKKNGNEQQEVLETGKPHMCTGATFVDPTYIAVDDKQKRIPNTSAYWENNCQESYLYSGSIIMPDTTSLFPIPVTRAPKNKIRSSCPSTPNVIIPMVRPIRSSRPFFTTSPSFDSVIKTSINDKNNVINICPASNDVTINNPDDCNSTGIVVRDPNQNAGASVSCTATIDTKIEHALDVVKSHLTHAVRLEVEELKVKINELVDRISYLEYENDLLRANVAPDVLQNLENSSGK